MTSADPHAGGGAEDRVDAEHGPKVPTMNTSEWAKLISCITPYTMV